MSPDGRYVVHIKTADGKSSLWIRQTAAASDVEIVPPDEVRYDGLTFSPDGNFVYYTAYGRLGGTAYLHRIPVLGGARQKLIDDIDSRVSFSPDARQFAFMRGAPASGRNYLMIANADGSGVRELSAMTAAEQFQLNAPAWAPDGGTILAGVQALKDLPHQAVAAVDVKTGAARIVGGRWGIAADVDWMPDGRSFVVIAIDFSGQTRQVWQVMFPSGERHRITNDLNAYWGVSVSRDGTSIATVQVENVSNLWIADAVNPARTIQVTTGRKRFDATNGLTWTTDDRLFFISSATGRPQVWSMNADGTNQRALTNEATPPLFLSAALDGRFVVFQSPQETGMILKRIAGDGGNAENLSKGGSEQLPIVSGDGRWVYYTSLSSGSPRAFRVASDGGEPVALGDGFFRPVSVSPDGQLLLGVGWDGTARRAAVATLPASGGTPSLLPVPVGGPVGWSPDGKAITYAEDRNGASNVFQRTPDSKERQLTRFTSDVIWSFGWSPDGKRLAVARGPVTSDVVLLSRKTAEAR
jgi:Tol biopolymer transport system component